MAVNIQKDLLQAKDSKIDQKDSQVTSKVFCKSYLEMRS